MILESERVLIKSKRTVFLQLICKQVLSHSNRSIVRKGVKYVHCRYLDIAKRFHEASIIDQVGNVVVKRIHLANSHSGFLKLMEAVGKLDAPAEFSIEATEYYWLPLYAHLRQEKQTVHVINPLQSDALRVHSSNQTPKTRLSSPKSFVLGVTLKLRPKTFKFCANFAANVSSSSTSFSISNARLSHC